MKMKRILGVLLTICLIISSLVFTPRFSLAATGEPIAVIAMQNAVRGEDEDSDSDTDYDEEEDEDDYDDEDDDDYDEDDDDYDEDIPYVKKVSSLKAKGGTKKITLTWKKNTAVSGYQIQYAMKSNFKKSKTVSVSKGKKSVVIRGVKSGKYFIRMRAYKLYVNENGNIKKAYSAYAKKAVRIV